MIRGFKDLIVWQKGHELVLLTYKTTREFPVEEAYGLSSQMRRAAVSVTSNIAEGFGRHSSKDREHFYVMAYGSLTELENQYTVALDLKYMNDKEYLITEEKMREVGQLMNGLLRAHRKL